MKIFFILLGFIHNIFSGSKRSFNSKIESLEFPIVDHRITWHINAVLKGLSKSDLELANLSYAKLIECIRQQIEDKIAGCEDALIRIKNEYDVFRNVYNLEYPKNFIQNENLKIDSIGYDSILDKHFELNDRIVENYKKREEEIFLQKAILACEEQINLSSQAKKGFKKEYKTEPLPAHTGYTQLSIILEKQNKFEEAINLSKKALKQGWNGDWENRIERLQRKLKKNE